MMRMPSNPGLDDAYSECARIAREHYENFPTASLALPRRVRRHVAAVYAFARAADDFADEPGIDNRLQRLDDWEGKLHRCLEGNEPMAVFRALGDTIRTFGLPVRLFVDLLDAFRWDVRANRHESFDELLDYSRLSANPVGRLLLLIFGFRDEGMARESDAICTALQLANFWQDVRVDLERDRIYIPQAELCEAGITEDDLRARAVDDRFRGLMASLVARTREIFDRGRPLGGRLPGRLGLDIRMISLGGNRILDLIEEAGFDVFRQRPRLRAADKVTILFRALRGEPRVRGESPVLNQPRPGNDRE